jgi:Flp pilus assembly protein TadB
MMYMAPRAARPERASHRKALLFAARRPEDRVDLAARPARRRAVQVAIAGSSPQLVSAGLLPSEAAACRKSTRRYRPCRLSRRGTGSSMGMLAIVAAIIFAIAWVINATGTATNAWFSVTDLLFIGLACLALHQAGIGSAWVRRR